MAKKRASRKRSSGVNLEAVVKWSVLVGLVMTVPIALIPGLHILIYLLFLVLALVTGLLFVKKSNELHFLVLAIALFTFNAFLNPFPYGQIVGAVLNTVGLFLGLASIAVVLRNIVGWFIPE